ncbi:MAG: lytic murein transglycosylase, partial [Pseudomonadota bacterium]
MRRTAIFAAVAGFAMVQTAAALAPERSPRPEFRTLTAIQANVSAAASNRAFERWIDGFRRRALSQGIRPQVFDAAFRGVRYQTDVIQRDRNQAEFTKQIWEYLESAVSDTRVRNGKAALREHRRVLSEIEARYGVEAEVVVAVWGLESAYGTFRG